jgi:hypothetical protein
MPVFHNPRVVIVSEGSGGLAAALAVVALAVVISSAAVLIADVLTAILVTMTALALAGTGILAIILRRTGLRTPLPPGAARTPAQPPSARTAQALTGPPLAIEAAGPVYGPTAVHHAEVIEYTPGAGPPVVERATIPGPS